MTSATPQTNVDLRVHHQRRERIESALHRLASVATRLAARSTVQAVERALRSLHDDRFKMVVVGEFSRGKSTVVNALLGDRVLPASAQPTTTVLSRIAYAEEATFSITLRDQPGSGRRIAREEFMRLVAPPEPIPGDSASEREYDLRLAELQRIAFAEIGYPAPLCRNGVEIVDTPGTNDLDAAREQITYNFIPQADAVIMVLSAKMILARTEMDFLRDRILKADIQRIFFAINFADGLRTPADRQKIMDYARDNLREVVPDPRLFLVCAKAALGHRRGSAPGSELMAFEETGFTELEQALSAFLANERGFIKLAKPLHQGFRLCEELSAGPLAVAKATVGMGLAELQTKIRQLEPDVARLQRERDQALVALRSSLEHHGLALAQELRQGLERIADTACRTVEAYTGPLTRDEVAQAIERVVAPLQTELQAQLRERQQAALVEECGRAQRRLQRAWDDLYLSLDRVFEVRGMGVGDIDVAPSYETPLAVAKTGLAVMGVGAVAALLHLAEPISLMIAVFTGNSLFEMFKQQARSRALGQVRAQVDRRFRDVIPETARSFERDWRNLTEVVVTQGAEAVNTSLRGLQEQLEHLLSEHRSLATQADDRRRVLAGLEQELTGIRASLAAAAHGGIP